MTESPPPLVREKKTPGGKTPASKTPDSPSDRSLVDDVRQLVDDGKTYVEAELAYQSTRAQFVAKNASKAAIMGLGGAVFVLIALIALSVGVLIGLIPLVGIWLSTAIVTGFWVLVAAILFLRMRSKFREISDAMKAPDKQPEPEEVSE